MSFTPHLINPVLGCYAGSSIHIQEIHKTVIHFFTIANNVTNACNIMSNACQQHFSSCNRVSPNQHLDFGEFLRQHELQLNRIICVQNSSCTGVKKKKKKREIISYVRFKSHDAMCKTRTHSFDKVDGAQGETNQQGYRPTAWRLYEAPNTANWQSTECDALVQQQC